MFKLLYFIADRAIDPLSRGLQGIAVRSPAFRSVCQSTARYIRSAQNERNISRGEAPLPYLSQEVATATGCDLLGEACVWGIGLAILYHEQSRSLRENETT